MYRLEWTCLDSGPGWVPETREALLSLGAAEALALAKSAVVHTRRYRVVGEDGPVSEWHAGAKVVVAAGPLRPSEDPFLREMVLGPGRPHP